MVRRQTANCPNCPNPIRWRTDVPAVIDVIPLGGDDAKVVAKSPGTANVFAQTEDYCGHTVDGNVATVTVMGHGYNVTWKGTLSGNRHNVGDNSDPAYHTPPTIRWNYTDNFTGYWTGSAVIGFDKTLQSATTSGYYDEYSTRINEWFCGNAWHPYLTTEDVLITITDAGADQWLKAIFSGGLFEYPDSDYIKDPILFSNPYSAWLLFLISSLSTDEIDMNYFTVDQNNHTDPCPWIPMEYHNTTESAADFPFWSPEKTVTPLTPDDSTGMSFSKNVQATFTEQVDGFNGTVTWEIRVIKSP